MRIMAFSPHPDDVEMLCGGTLAKYKAQGHDVAITLVTNGNVGSPTMTREQTAAVREKEARAAAAVISAEFFAMGYDDEFLYDSPEVRRHFIDVLRAFDPHIVLGPDKDADYLTDHTRTGKILWDVRILTTVPNIPTAHAPTQTRLELWYYDTIAGVHFEPEQYVDITAHWETKVEMVRCHASQNAWLEDQYGIPPTYYAETQSRFRGYQAGCMFAEAFRRAREFPQQTPAGGTLPTAHKD